MATAPDDEPPNKPPDSTAAPLDDATIEQIRQSLKGLRFGSVTIILQDGVIVQIDRTEKRRPHSKRREKPAE
jgi:hypothetical protein